MRSEKGKTAIKRVLESLCGAFGVSFLPLEVEEALEKGHRVTVWHPRWEALERVPLRALAKF